MDAGVIIAITLIASMIVFGLKMTKSSKKSGSSAPKGGGSSGGISIGDDVQDRPDRPNKKNML